MPRYSVKLVVEFESDDPDRAEAVMKEFLAEGLSNLHYNGTLDPYAHWVVTAGPLRELKGRKKRCPRCKGTGTILGHRLYPGTQADRPTVTCGTCKGAGSIRTYPGHQGLDQHREALGRHGPQMPGGRRQG
ncbi:MAG TPA: hypothetical protein VLA19_31520 [Herpetosiphonaceae bacterium]|nr:hypothetical protein [Herpetosiphonaceae bacterium]